MNNKVTPENFRASMDRVLSGSKADPFLASRIIAAEKGEPKMKKASVSIALVLLILIILATVAYAASKMSHSVNWKGETINEYPDTTDEEFAEFKAKAGMSMNEAFQIAGNLAAEVPDSYVVSVTYDLPGGQISGGYHSKRKRFTSLEEFKAYMADYDYLTLPAWLPEDMTGFNAEVHMDMSPVLHRNDIEIEEYQDGPAHYSRYTFDDSLSVVTGYRIEFYIGLGNVWVESYVYNESKYSEPGNSLGEKDVVRVVNVKGMEDSLLTSTLDNKVISLEMHHKLPKIVRYKDLDQPIPHRCDEERLSVSSAVLDEDTTLRIFNGE